MDILPLFDKDKRQYIQYLERLLLSEHNIRKYISCKCEITFLKIFLMTPIFANNKIWPCTDLKWLASFRESGVYILPNINVQYPYTGK